MMRQPANRERMERLDRRLATMLSWGTWIATAAIIVTLAAPGGGTGMQPWALRLATAGIGLMIALPVARVLMMALAFFRACELDFAMIATLVFAIIALSLFVGLH
jgi:hypothetical protein